MKSKVYAIFTVLIALLFCSCGKQEARKHRIGILAPAVTHGWVAGTAFYAEQRCKELAQQDVEYKILTSSNAEEMTQQLDELQAWKAEAIVVYPQWKGMEVPIANVISQGIPVISFDIAIDAKGVYLVSGDNVGMGEKSAEYLLNKLGNEATIVALEVPTSGSVSEQRMQGFMSVMQEKAPNAKILRYATQFTRDAGLKDFSDIMTANAHIDGVFSMDDELSIGILQAIREAGRQDIKVITGGGGCQEYFKLMQETNDIALVSALYSPAMLIDAVNEAYDLILKKDVAQQNIIPTKIVDASNAAEHISPNSPY